MNQDKLTELLLAARCPNPDCDGFGTVEGVAEIDEPACCGDLLPDGECCGQAVATQYVYQDMGPCQWCHERAELLNRPALLESPETTPLEIDDIDNQLPI